MMSWISKGILPWCFFFQDAFWSYFDWMDCHEILYRQYLGSDDELY